MKIIHVIWLCSVLGYFLSSCDTNAAFRTELQGQSKGDTNWVSVNLQNWKELDHIPIRVFMTGGPVSNYLVTVNFDHTKNLIPGLQNLTGFTASSNVVIKSPPFLDAPLGNDIWNYTFRVDVLDSNAGNIQFLGRLSAGAHLFVGSSLGLASPTLQIHKPAAAPGNPDLMINKTGASHAVVGETITYTVFYTNLSSPFNTAATGVQISDLLPECVSYVPGSATGGGTLAANVLTWDIAGLAVGGSGSFSYQVVVGANAVVGQTFTNWARIFSAENDVDFANNESAVTTLVDATASINSVPTAADDSYETDEDSALIVGAPGVLSNDSDMDGNSLTAIFITGTTNGSISFNADGSFLYSPVSNYYGVDSFTYFVNDGTTNSTAAKVTITVLPRNDAPVANGDEFSTDEDVTLIVPAVGVLANDNDPDGDPLRAILLSNVAHGTLSLSTNGAFSYTPAANYNGSDSFVYSANDGVTNSAHATVNLLIRPLNDRPTALNDSYNTDEDVPLTVNASGVLGNDSDNDGTSLRSLLVAGPAHGSLTLNANGSFIYTPYPNYSGSDSFTYVANDGLTNSLVATVSLSVRPVNDVPAFTIPSLYAVNEDSGEQLVSAFAGNISAGALDEEGQQLVFSLVNSTSNLFSVQPDVDAAGTLTFTPAPDAFGTSVVTIVLTDNGGTLNGGKNRSSPQSFLLVINPVNDPPSFIRGSDQSVLQNASAQTIPNWATQISSGPDNEIDQTTSFSVTHDNPTLFSDPPAINMPGTLTYTPAVGACGIAHVSVVLTDNGGTANGGVDTCLVQEFVIRVNGPPTARIISPTNGSVFLATAPITILCSAADPDGIVTNLVLMRDSAPVANLSAPYLYAWTNAAPGSYQLGATAFDNSGLTANAEPVEISVIAELPLTIVSSMRFNPQTGLFEQTVRVGNPTSAAFPAIRVLVRNLPSGASVYNNSGTTNGVQYVQYNSPIPSGQSAEFRIEYYVPSRIAPSPHLAAEPVAAAPGYYPTGTSVEIDRVLQLFDGSMLIDFTTSSNRTYYIQYSCDMLEWETAMPCVTGNGNRMQWLDNGPPKTDAWPSKKPVCVYRILQMP